jgi:cyclic-di-AMP phosphodiesterase PgpH
MQQGNPKNLESDAFRYPGMRPQTRETAIVMLVDSIEAASRTVDPPEREAFEQMIQRIIFTKLKDGQLDDSGLNMSDLNVIATRMSDILVNMHHHRIKYHWQAQRAEEFGVPSTAVQNLALRAFQTAGERKSQPPSEPILEAYELTAEPPGVAPVVPATGPPPTTRSTSGQTAPPGAAQPTQKASGAHPAIVQNRDRSGGTR